MSKFFCGLFLGFLTKGIAQTFEKVFLDKITTKIVDNTDLESIDDNLKKKVGIYAKYSKASQKTEN